MVGFERSHHEMYKDEVVRLYLGPVDLWGYLFYQVQPGADQQVWLISSHRIFAHGPKFLKFMSMSSGLWRLQMVLNSYPKKENGSNTSFEDRISVSKWKIKAYFLIKSYRKQQGSFQTNYRFQYLGQLKWWNYPSIFFNQILLLKRKNQNKLHQSPKDYQPIQKSRLAQHQTTTQNWK